MDLRVKNSRFIKFTTAATRAIFHWIEGRLWILSVVIVGILLFYFYSKMARNYIDPMWPFSDENMFSCSAKNSDILPQLGTLGDFIGGILNPIISVLALSWLVKSVLLQKQELKDAKQLLSQQGFDQRFFPLLQILTDSANRILDNTAPPNHASWMVKNFESQSTTKIGLEQFAENFSLVKDYVVALNAILYFVCNNKASIQSKSSISPEESFYISLVMAHVNTHTTPIILYSAMAFRGGEHGLFYLLALCKRYKILTEETHLFILSANSSLLFQEYNNISESEYTSIFL